MICKKCGMEATDQYCSKCGMPLAEFRLGDYRSITPLLLDLRAKEAITKEIIASSKPLSAEEWLSLADRFVSPQLNLLVNPRFDRSAKLGHELWTSLGVKTQSVLEKTFRTGFGYVAMSALCYLARHSMTITSIVESDSVCTVFATVPSNWLTFDGVVRVAIQARREESVVIVEAGFPGQWIDWGRGSRLVRSFLEFVEDMSNKLSGAEL